MRRALFEQIEIAAGGTVGVRPYVATDADLPPIFWPEGESPACAFDEFMPGRVEIRSGPQPEAGARSSAPDSYRRNCARRRIPPSGYWSRGRKTLDPDDGYCILLRIESSLWEQGERIPEVQAILNLCRRLVLAEMGKTVSQ